MAHVEEIIYTQLEDMDEARILEASRRASSAGLWVITTATLFESLTEQWGRQKVAMHALRQPRARYLHPDIRRSWRFRNPYTGRKGSGGNNLTISTA